MYIRSEYTNAKRIDSFSLFSDTKVRQLKQKYSFVLFPVNRPTLNIKSQTLLHYILYVITLMRTGFILFILKLLPFVVFSIRKQLVCVFSCHGGGTRRDSDGNKTTQQNQISRPNESM